MKSYGRPQHSQPKERIMRSADPLLTGLTVLLTLTVPTPAEAQSPANLPIAPDQMPQAISTPAQCGAPARSSAILETTAAQPIFRDVHALSMGDSIILSGRLSAGDEAQPHGRIILRTASGEVIAPPHSPTATTSFLPMAIAVNRWGVLWLELDTLATARQQTSGLVRFAERDIDGWQPTRTVWGAGLMDWGTGVRTAPHPDGGTFMVGRIIMGPPAVILFAGRLPDRLTPIQLPGRLPLLHDVLAIGDTLELAVLAQVGAQSRDGVAVFLLRSVDGGNTWTSPERVWTPAYGAVAGMAYRVTPDGTRHILLGGIGDDVQHLAIPPTGEPVETSLSVPGLVIAGSVGSNTCDGLTYFLNVIRPDHASFYAAHWTTAGWTPWQQVMEDHIGVMMFDVNPGRPDWHIGWTGLPLNETRAVERAGIPTALKVWLARVQ
jgi:hypothetical protein